MRRIVLIAAGLAGFAGVALVVASQPLLIAKLRSAMQFILVAIKPEIGKKLPADVPPLETAEEATGWRPGRPVFIRLFKRESELELWGRTASGWRLVKTYPICAWSGRLGPKMREGDYQSPEGFYTVSKAQLNPNSAYHLSFNLGFPNAVERAQGRTGSFLMVHGNCVSVGCYAITDEGVEEVYGAVKAALDAGQKSVTVHAFPFRMTQAAMAEQEDQADYAFWQALKPGYDLFEKTKEPPQIFACGDAYGFEPRAGCRAL